MRRRTCALEVLVSVMLGATCLLAPLPNATADINNPASIDDFVGCLNQRLQGTQPDISNAVQCLPKGCKFLMTMSNQSAQAACTLAGCQSPRVIFDCPGPPDQNGKDQGLRLRPSFLLCPVNSRPAPADVLAGADDEYGINRIEMGEDTTHVDVAKETGRMRMADIPIHPGANYVPKAVDDELSLIIRAPNGDPSNRGSKACNQCHEGPTDAPDFPRPQESNPLNPYSPSGPINQVDLRPYVIFDHPDGSRIVADADKKDGNGDRIKIDGVDVTNVSGLKQICDCVKKNGVGAQIQQAVRTPVADDPRRHDPNFKIETLVKLCDQLLAYETNKACGKMPGTRCVTAAGGGKFLDTKKSVSMLRFDMTGDARLPAPNALTFTDRDGALSAYNYLTRKNIEVFAFSSVEASLLGGTVVNGAWVGDFSVTALGRGTVNGVNTNLRLQLKKLGGTLSFELRNADTAALLAGGTGEGGRSDFVVKLRAP